MNKEKIQTIDVKQLLSELKSTPDGLSNGEANKRLELDGPNILKNDDHNNAFKLFIKQFKSSLIYLLLIASGLSFILGDYHDGIIIAVILLVNTGLGFYQALKSENAVSALQKLVDREVLCIREGKQSLISEKNVVIGDIIVLREGDIVPADIRLLMVNDLTVNESQISGESEPIAKKNDGPQSLIFAGSTIEQGEGRGVVYAVSADTELGKIAHLSSSTKRVTQFEKSLASFSTFLVRVTFITLLAIFILKLFLIHDTSHIGTLIIFIVALSIAVVPEAMPVIVTVTLARGALKLAKQHVIAKTLTAVEDLGNITVLCSDKTGTLTENKQTIKQLIANDPKLFQRLAIASLESFDEKRKKFQSSFDKAFITFVSQEIKDETKNYIRLKELPFDPNARRRRVVFKDGTDNYLVEVGSVETLMELTNEPKKDEYMNTVKADGEKGLRHLGVAYKKLDALDIESFDILKHENGLEFVGFVSLEDPLRPSAKHTIVLAEKLGVDLKILSGDSREVTRYVGMEAGLVDSNQTVHTGEEIEKMSDLQLADILKNNNAFARLNPEQKFRIIKLLQLQGHVVGYQGDGINDAPALKVADVAIAVNNATDVAQESADILLLRSDLNVIVNGIKEGRGIFSNINKYIRYTMTSNFGAFFSLGALYLLSATLPLLTIQLLLSNLISSIPLIAIVTDNVDNQELAAPSLYNNRILFFISMFLGMYTALFYLIFFAIVKTQALPVTRTSLYLFMTITNFVVIFSVRNKQHFYKAPRLSKTLTIAFGSMAALVIGAIYFKPTESLFSFVPLSFRSIGLVILMTVIYFVFLDLTKVWFYRTNLGNSTEKRSLRSA
jgi:Mg2+-importing ATPase